MLLNDNDLELLPYAAMEIRGGAVSAMNTAAQNQLPQLSPGTPVPDELAQSLSAHESAGSFTWEGDTFLFSRAADGEKQVILLRPAQSSAVTGAQLEGFSRQMREQMGKLYNQLQLQPSSPELTQSSHSFHQMLRLVNNLEFLNIPLEQAKALFHPVAMDLAGLCMNVKRQAAPLLRKAQVELCFASDCTGLLIPGDPELLQRLLLGLISNAAKVSVDGRVTLGLRPWRDRAVLTVTDSGQGLPDLAALLPNSETADAIPAPGEGAGMGLEVARRIAALHRGTLLARTGREGGMIFTVSLPVGPLPTSAALRTPKMEQEAGISPFLLELSDVLPSQLFDEV